VVAAYLAAADVLLVVVDCGQPPSGAELAALAQLCWTGGALVVVLNKADSVGPEHAHRMRAAASAALPAAAVVAVSSRVERAHLAGGGAGRAPDGGFAALVAVVEAALGSRSVTSARGALADVAAAVATLQATVTRPPVDATWKARFRTRMRRIGQDLLRDLDAGIAAAPAGPRGGLRARGAALDGALHGRAGALAARARAAVADELGLLGCRPAPLSARPRPEPADPVAAVVGIGAARLATVASTAALPGGASRVALAELVERLARDGLAELATRVAARGEAGFTTAPDAADLEAVGVAAAAVPALDARLSSAGEGAGELLTGSAVARQHRDPAVLDAERDLDQPPVLAPPDGAGDVEFH
jgi:hypothetical protein